MAYLPAMNLIQTQVASNSASISFTRGITGYNSYFLSINDLITAVNEDPVSMVLSTNGGSSYVASGYLSNWSWLQYSSSPASLSWAGATATTSILLFQTPENSGMPASGKFWLNNLTAIPNIFGEGFENAGGSYLHFLVNATNTGLTGVNAIQIAGASGNLTSGTFSLYGVT